MPPRPALSSPTPPSPCHAAVPHRAPLGQSPLHFPRRPFPARERTMHRPQLQHIPRRLSREKQHSSHRSRQPLRRLLRARHRKTIRAPRKRIRRPVMRPRLPHRRPHLFLRTSQQFRQRRTRRPHHLRLRPTGHRRRRRTARPPHQHRSRRLRPPHRKRVLLRMHKSESPPFPRPHRSRNQPPPPNIFPHPQHHPPRMSALDVRQHLFLSRQPRFEPHRPALSVFRLQHPQRQRHQRTPSAPPVSTAIHHLHAAA